MIFKYNSITRRANTKEKCLLLITAFWNPSPDEGLKLKFNTDCPDVLSLVSLKEMVCVKMLVIYWMSTLLLHFLNISTQMALGKPFTQEFSTSLKCPWRTLTCPQIDTFVAQIGEVIWQKSYPLKFARALNLSLKNVVSSVKKHWYAFSIQMALKISA